MDAVERDRIVLAGVVCAVMFAQVLLYPGAPDVVSALGGSTNFDASQLFLAVEFVAFVLFATVWGAASDVTGRRAPLISAGAVGGAAGYLALAALPSLGGAPFEVVLALRVVQGAMTVGALSLAMAMLMDLPGGHGQNMGAAGIAIGIGVATGSPIGGQLAARDPLLVLVVAGGAMLAVGIAALLMVDRVPDGDRGEVREALASLSGTPELVIPYAFGFIDRLTAGFFALAGTFYFRDVFGLGPAERGIVLALFFAPFALLQYPFGTLSDRIGRRVPIVGGSLAYGLAAMSVGLAGTLMGVQIAMVAVGVLGALMAPATMALVTDLASEDQRGTAMGGFNIFGSLGFLAGIVAGETATLLGYRDAFLLVGGLEVAIALVAIVPLLRLDLPVEDVLGLDRWSR